MPVYTVREVTSDRKAASHLVSRGISGTSVTMTQLSPIALPDKRQLAYDVYSKLLPAFLLATYTDSTLPTSRQGYNLSLKWGECLPIAPPPVCVRFKKELSSEEVEKVKALGGSVFAQKGTKNSMYSWGSGQVTPDLLSFLLKHAKEVEHYNPTPNASINLGAFKWFIKALGIATMFVKTQSYPAFTGQLGPDDDVDGSYTEIDGFLKRKRVAQKPVSQKKAKEMETSNDMEIDDEDHDEFDGDFDEYMFGSGDSSVPKAKPSEQAENPWGEPATLPSLPGISFPYFRDMLAHDPNFVCEVIREYFLLSLGDEKDSIIAAFKQMKGALGAVAMSETGNILQHLFCGIRLAIMGQTRLFPVIKDGGYLGFVLLGWKFSVAIDGYRHNPIEHKELLPEINKMDEHRVAVAEIVMKLSKMKLAKTGKVPTQSWLKAAVDSGSQNPRQLVKTLNECKIEDSVVDEIEKIANRLSYQQRFLAFTTENIHYAVDLLVSGSFPPADKPMWTRGGTLTTKSPELSIFAMFGDSAFSFRTPGGNAHTIPSEFKEDTLFAPYKGKGGKETFPNPTMILAKKNLALCVSDWKELLLTKAILMKSSRDQAFRSIIFGGKESKIFWKGFVDRVGPLMKSDEAKDLNADEVELGKEPADDGNGELELGDLL